MPQSSPPRRLSRRLHRASALLSGVLSALCALSAASCGPPVPAAQTGLLARGVDEDGDGVPDGDDACPNEEEDGLAPKANDGCAAPDPDRDGVTAAMDRCPDAKEDRLFPKTDDGCPMADADHDGVGDTEDKCSDRAEDNVDPFPNDGCPAPDGDADGVPDVLDACPAQPETINGYRDADGCPDSAPKATLFDAESSEIAVAESARPALFDESSELSPEAESAASGVAQVLAAHPEIDRVEIEVHTATRGDPAYNVTVTARRAEALAQALSKLGVDAHRLVPIGYGEQCPAVDRGDDVDEPRNRRVVFKVVRREGAWQSVPRGCWRAQAAGIDPTKRKPEPAPTEGQP